jgi:hypothetical protein
MGKPAHRQRHGPFDPVSDGRVSVPISLFHIHTAFAGYFLRKGEPLENRHDSDPIDLQNLKITTASRQQISLAESHTDNIMFCQYFIVILSVAHKLSGLGWSSGKVTDETDRDATGDPGDAI